MQLLLRANGQQVAMSMENAGEQVVLVGEHRYRPAHMAQKVRKLAARMWGAALTPDILDQRLTFEALDEGRSGFGDSGSFSPRSGSYVTLGRWDEDGSVGIALHELAHEMHMRSGGYDDSDGVLREALSLLAEREAGSERSFEREPYYTASNLVGQLAAIGAFARQPFARRWEELVALTTDVALADLVNYYLDKSERIGLARWLQRFSESADLRDALMGRLAVTSLRYSIDFRRRLLVNLVRCDPATPADQIAYVLDSIATLDKRYPGDDLGRIIDFCFAPHMRQRRGLFAFGASS
jgi:hypothetical protein